MQNKQEVLKELKEQYDKCDELFNESYMLNRHNFTRTEFTQKVTNYMADLTQTLGYIIGELE